MYGPVSTMYCAVRVSQAEHLVKRGHYAAAKGLLQRARAHAVACDQPEAQARALLVEAKGEKSVCNYGGAIQLIQQAQGIGGTHTHTHCACTCNLWHRHMWVCVCGIHPPRQVSFRGVLHIRYEWPSVCCVNACMCACVVVCAGDYDFWRETVSLYVECRLAAPHTTTTDAREALQGGIVMFTTIAR